MIDEKGRIFGFINIIDLVIIFAVIGAIIFIALKTKEKPALQNVTLKFYNEELPSYITDKIKVGDNVYDDSKEMFLGSVTDFVVDEGFSFNPDVNGINVKSNKEGYSSLELTTELTAQTAENGIIIEGNKYGIGHGLTIRIGETKFYFRISDLQKS